MADIPRPNSKPDELVVCPQLRIGDEIIRTLTIVSELRHRP
ncbi:MAG: hypothetical protein WBP81_14585 [Solirubrobacteraceae bacterium]